MQESFGYGIVTGGVPISYANIFFFFPASSIIPKKYFYILTRPSFVLISKETNSFD